MSCHCSHNETETNVVCPCDDFRHPLPLSIGAGLHDLPRQVAGFPEFRRAMLRAVGLQPSLQGWRAREEKDLGVMLLEMWAYVCDSLAFYDQAIAQESYINTSRLRPSVRKLVALLGYLPAPATAGQVILAALADGRSALTLPAGTAFRSTSANGVPSQVFELTTATVVHPLASKWRIAKVIPTTILQDNPVSLLLEPKAELKSFTRLILLDYGDPTQNQVLRIKEVLPYTGADGKKYTRVVFQAPAKLRAGTPLARLWLLIPDANSILWHIGSVLESNSGHTLALLKKQANLFDLSDEYDWDALAPAHLAPAARTLAAAFRKPAPDPVELALRFAVPTAGVIVNEPKATLSPMDPLVFDSRIEAPADLTYPDGMALVDKNLRGELVRGKVNYDASSLRLGMGSGWEPELTDPVDVFGNLLEATRGETVRNELLGSGNALLSGQRFKLAKKPLTYLLSPAAGNDRGVENTLRVYVNGIRWKEIPSFFGVAPEDEVYIVRQDDEEESYVIFGDGVRGKRVPSGADNVVAYYRYGAGGGNPPAGSISQIKTPVPGLASVRNPTAAAGGSDVESREKMRTHAPRSALILGRAVSIQDMEAIALAFPAVRNVQAEWRWNGVSQTPGVLIWYIGEAGIEPVLSKRLRSLTDPATPIVVKQALAASVSLTVDVAIDPRFLEENVLPVVRTVLIDGADALLRPEKVGIGRPLFRSQIFERILQVAGTVSVRNLLWNGAPFSDYGQKPATGSYFDFENGGIILNGYT